MKELKTPTLDGGTGDLGADKTYPRQLGSVAEKALFPQLGYCQDKGNTDQGPFTGSNCSVLGAWCDFHFSRTWKPVEEGELFSH